METEVKESNAGILRDYTEDVGDGESKINLMEAFKVITDKYCGLIRLATSRRPMSAIELSLEFDIPIAACYRRINLLKKAGILICTDRVVSRRGKKISKYVSVLRNCFIFIEGGKFSIKFELTNGSVKEYRGVHPLTRLLSVKLD